MIEKRSCVKTSHHVTVTVTSYWPRCRRDGTAVVFIRQTTEMSQEIGDYAAVSAVIKRDETVDAGPLGLHAGSVTFRQHNISTAPPRSEHV